MRLVQASGFILPGEHLEEGLVVFDLALLADVFERERGYLRGGDGGACALSRARLQAGELFLKIGDLALQADDLRILIGG